MEGKFSVRSFYPFLCEAETVSFPWKSIGKLQLPPRLISSFGRQPWVQLRPLTTWGGEASFFLANRCCMWKEEKESVDHLLLQCEVASDLWGTLCGIFGVSWVILASVLQLLMSWEERLQLRRVKKAWKMAPLCLLWSIMLH